VPGSLLGLLINLMASLHLMSLSSEFLVGDVCRILLTLAKAECIDGAIARVRNDGFRGLSVFIGLRRLPKAALDVGGPGPSDSIQPMPLCGYGGCV